MIRSFTVPGVPVPWERARVRVNHRIVGGPTRLVTAPRTRLHQEKIRAYARNAGIRLLEGILMKPPLVLACRFYLPDGRVVDDDNLVKSVRDALNRIAWADDSEIGLSLTAKIPRSREPRTEIVFGGQNDLESIATAFFVEVKREREEPLHPERRPRRVRR